MARKSPNRTTENPGRHRHLAPTVYRPELGRNVTEVHQYEPALEGGDVGEREESPRRVLFRRSTRADVHSRERSDRSGIFSWNVAV